MYASVPSLRVRLSRKGRTKVALDVLIHKEAHRELRERWDTTGVSVARVCFHATTVKLVWLATFGAESPIVKYVMSHGTKSALVAWSNQGILVSDARIITEYLFCWQLTLPFFHINMLSLIYLRTIYSKSMSAISCHLKSTKVLPKLDIAIGILLHFQWIKLPRRLLGWTWMCHYLQWTLFHSF